MKLLLSVTGCWGCVLFMISSVERCLEGEEKILQSLTAKCPIRLSWTHYSIIQQETTADGRIWYENEAAKEMWSY